MTILKNVCARQRRESARSTRSGGRSGSRSPRAWRTLGPHKSRLTRSIRTNGSSGVIQVFGWRGSERQRQWVSAILESMRAAFLLNSLIVVSLSFACSAGNGSQGDGGGTGDGDGDGDGDGGDGDGDAAGVGGSEDGDLGSGGVSTDSGGGPAAGGGMGSGGDDGSGSCTPNPSGGFAVDGDVVHDEVTCLTWQKGWVMSEDAKDAVEDAYPGAAKADAEATCDTMNLGGFDDWRLPTLGEIATIDLRCNDWVSATPPPWPIEFDITAGAVWTSTPVAEKYCAIEAQGGGSPSSSYSSGPGVRCVRGSGTVAAITDCSAASIPSCN